MTSLNLGNNQIGDISPLVDSEGLGSGDEVWLENNPLSATSQNKHISALQTRGVTVHFTEPENYPPVANAGADQTVTTGTTVTLDGTGSSDTDGSVASYLWTVVSSPEEVVLSSTTVSQPTFTPETPGSHVFSLVVTDDKGAQSDPDEVEITVTEPADVTAPAAPTDLAAIPGDAQVTLTWSPNTESDLSHYVIYRSMTSGFTPAISDSVGRANKRGSTFTDTGLANGMTHYYRISAVDTAGNESVYSEQVHATPKALDVTTSVPDLSISAGSHDFGDVVIQSSERWVLTLRNEGTEDLRVFELAVAAPFEIDRTSGTIPPGDSLQVEITFRPTDVGSYGRDLTIQSSDPDEGILTVHLSGIGTAIPVPDISLSEDEHDFGGVRTNISATWELTIYSVGTDDLNLSEVSTYPPFTSEPASGIIPPGDSLSVMVTFRPTEVQTYAESLTIRSDDPDVPVRIVSLTGTGIPVPAPDIAFSASSHDFGEVIVQTTVRWTLTLFNVGTVDLAISKMATESPFTLDRTSGTIPPGDSLQVEITFRPTDVGSYERDLTIRTDDPDEGEAAVQLIGTGRPVPAPHLTSSEGIHDFGTVDIGSRDTWVLTLRNDGDADLVVTGILSSEENRFPVDPPVFPQTIPPSEDVEVTVQFVPSLHGLAEAQLTVRSNDPVGDVSVALSGTGRDADPPVIVHAPPSKASEGQAISVTGTCSDNVGITRVYLFYREGGMARYDSTAMTSSDDSLYAASIPGSVVGGRGVEYYLAASDGVHRSTYPARDPEEHPQSIPIRVSGQSNPNVQPAGSEQTAYRMISVPMVLDDPLPSAVFPDDLGPYDSAQWRLFRYTQGRWYEFPNITEALIPGRAFWLIVKDSGARIDAGSGASTPTDAAFEIPLEPGWNDIGVPFAFPVDWDSIQWEEGVDLNGPYGYEGEWTDPTTTTRLYPWKGYAIRNLSDRSTTLRIPPIEAGGGNKVISDFGFRISDLESGTDLERTQSVGHLSSNALWTVRILAQCDRARDRINTLGCISDASETWDRYDQSEPPPIGSYVALYFEHSDWSTYPGRYTADYRPLEPEGMSWTFTVETNIPNAEVRLAFEGADRIPSGSRAALFDLSGYRTLDLRESTTYTFFPQGGEVRRREFRLSVGTVGYVDQVTREVPRAPEEFLVYPNYPNPFNAETALRYALPSSGRVRVTVFDPVGRRVRLLVDRLESPGYYTVSWDGRDDAGEEVGSGMYVWRIEASGAVRMGKMVLVR